MGEKMRKKSEQLKLELEEHIKNNNLVGGSQLPSEYDLMKLFEVSRAQIRAVTQLLVEEGVLKRKKGVGTFVCDDRVNNSLSAKWGLKNEVIKLGYELLTKECSIELVDIKLSDTQVANTYLIKRIRLIDNIPYVTSHCYVASELDLTKYTHEVSNSLYELLDRNNYYIDYFSDEISVCNANFEVVESLNLITDSKVIKKKREAYNIQGQRIEYSNSYFNPDYYKFEISITNEGKIK